MRSKWTILALLLLVGVAQLGFDGEPEGRLVVPEGWPAPHYDLSRNPLSGSRIALGRQLFYDPILSADNSVSCANCHLSYTAFTHVDHALSHGIRDSIGTRNSLALMNLAWATSFMWDGAINHLDMQALAPIAHPAEMGSDITAVVRKLNASPSYRQRFQQAYGDSVATGERVLKALAQFELTLVSANAKYDQVMRQEAAFSAQEQRGYALFQTHCNSCHREPLFTTGEFANNGLPLDPNLQDAGRMLVTQRSEDSLKFKIPTLRNVQFSQPYMHDGRMKTLHQVLQHYTAGIHQSHTLAPELVAGIPLSDSNRVDLQAFLLTLTDREFLFNPRHAFPRN